MSIVTILCRVCGRKITVIHSAEWNTDTCARCLPENPNPELARLLRMQAAERAK